MKKIEKTTLLMSITLLYLFLEIIYNVNLFNMRELSIFKMEDLKELEDFGFYRQILTSMGLTLLIYPYLPKEKIKNIATTALSFIFIYNITPLVLDAIIQTQSEHRYENYNSVLLKDGYRNGWLKVKHSDSDFDNQMIYHAFALYPIKDANAILLKNKDNLAHHVLSLKENEIDNNATVYGKMLTKRLNEWKEFEKIREKLHGGSYIITSEVIKGMIDEKIDTKYSEYKSKMKSYFDKKKEVYENMDNTYSKLKKYFKYRDSSKEKIRTIAENMYRKAMQDNFKRYVEPETWCSDDGWGNVSCPDYETMKEVIDFEIALQLSQRTDIPELNSREEFISYFRDDILKEIRKKGLNVPDNFDFSVESIATFIKDEHQRNYKKLKEEVRKKLGDDFDINWTYQEFIKSGYFTQEVEKYMPPEFVDNVREMFLKEDFSNIKKELIIPIASTKVEDAIILDKETLENKYPERGDNATKFLYFVLVSIALSALTILTNIYMLILNVIERYIPSVKKIYTIGFVTGIIILSFIFAPDLSLLEQGFLTSLISLLGGFEAILTLGS